MTRKNQTVRSWISRENPSVCWLSHVSHKGKVHTLRTPSYIRKAALQFNISHTILTLTKKPKLNINEVQHEPNI